MSAHAEMSVGEGMGVVRGDPKVWFQGFGRFLDEESRAPVRSPAKVLQRRMFEHYRRCLAAMIPCREVVLKFRRAGSSTASTAIMYHHVRNFRHRVGLIGTDYKASSNMMEMVKTFGRHDDFPGWSGGLSADCAEGRGFSETLEVVDWEVGLEKEIATKIQWADGPDGEPGARVELYTAENPKSARSAGLQGYLATEVGLWPKDGVKDGAATLVAMRNTLPKKGFHVAIEESTAQGAVGEFYKTCSTAQWPDYDDYWKQWESDWPLSRDRIGGDLQFVFIFAAWFEDDRNFDRLSASDAAYIEATLDAEPTEAQQPSYEGERDLIARYAQPVEVIDGRWVKVEGERARDWKGEMRLGGEVEATVWEQLAWRRKVIKQTGGLDNFKVEYPSNPREAFRASGSPVFDQAGLTWLEVLQRSLKGPQLPEHGCLDTQPNGALVWRRAPERESVFTVWEHPVVGRRYLLIDDPMSGCELVANSGTRDRHGVLMLRDAYEDAAGVRHLAKLVARIKPPCQWDNAPLARQIAALSKYYGGAPVVVESNMGVAMIEKLMDAKVNLYQQQDWIAAEQRTINRLGWRNDEGPRRMAVEKGREYVREKKVEVLCPHVLSEMKTFIFDRTGKAVGGGNHDDDVLALCIGLACLGAAKEYLRVTDGGAGARDLWKAR